jgi:hypothetical protein
MDVDALAPGSSHMLRIARIAGVVTLGLTLVSCSGSQSGNATAAASDPASAASRAITNPPSDHLPVRGAHGAHGARPNDVLGGGLGLVKGTLDALFIALGDASLPAGSPVAQINIGIDKVLATDPYGNVTTVAQYTSPQVVNVLAYQGGNTTPIALGTVATQTYATLTIIVDTASSNWVTTWGSTRQLSWALNQPSASTSGFGASTSVSAGPAPGTVAITFSQPFQVVGSSMNLDVDFNALESLAISPSGRWSSARPGLSLAQEGFEGSISGSVQNASGGAVTNAVVTATAANGTTEATAVTDANGAFLLHTLVAGPYTLNVYNQYVTASGSQVSSQGSTAGAYASGTVPIQGPSASVQPGTTTSVGSIGD